MGVIQLVAALVEIVMKFIPADSPCPICTARAAQPEQTKAAVEAANIAADALEKQKFGDK